MSLWGSPGRAQVGPKSGQGLHDTQGLTQSRTGDATNPSLCTRGRSCSTQEPQAVCWLPFISAGWRCSLNPGQSGPGTRLHPCPSVRTCRAGKEGMGWLCRTELHSASPTQLLPGTLRHRCSPRRSASLSQPRCPVCVPSFPIPTRLGSGRSGSMRCTGLTLVCLPPEYIGDRRE